MRHLYRIASITLTGIFLAVPARAELTLDFHEGRVTLHATGVTIQQVLSAWAAVGGTRIPNLERLGSGVLFLQLDDVPEKDALDAILSSTGGYVATQRTSKTVGQSSFTQILVLPESEIRLPAIEAAANKPRADARPHAQRPSRPLGPATAAQTDVLTNPVRASSAPSQPSSIVVAAGSKVPGQPVREPN